MKNISRRTAIKTVLAGSAAMAVSGMEAAALAKKKKVEKPEPLKGNIRHSVSNGVSAVIRWMNFVRFVKT